MSDNIDIKKSGSTIEVTAKARDVDLHIRVENVSEEWMSAMIQSLTQVAAMVTANRQEQNASLEELAMLQQQFDRLQRGQ